MSSAEIVAAFGQPSSKSSADEGRLFYFSPARLQKKASCIHFIGFQVIFKNDEVIDWSTTQGI